MNFNNVSAIFQKQIKDTLKNKAVLIQFIMHPLMALVMSKAVILNDMPRNFFVFLFATMYIGMSPLISMSSIISEEKENGVLRMLQLINVKPGEYLFGVGSYVFLLCLLFSVIFPLCGDYSVKESLSFLLIMALGILISILFGGAIGISSANQMSATSITVPVMMLFAFLPMIAMFNNTIAQISKWTYTQQLQDMLTTLSNLQLSAERLSIIGLNIAVAGILFFVIYRKTNRDI